MNTRPQIFTILLALLCLVFTHPAIASGPSHLLDGKAFVGNNGEKGQPLDPDEDEEIIFKNGMFHSVSCDPYNFGSSPYSAKQVGNTIHYEAETMSPSHGKIAWKGVVEGNTAEVNFVWTKERWYWDTRREYWFRGTLKE